ncbi:MAG: hypothetical protein U0353_06040 [Sandaracinus sp.]
MVTRAAPRLCSALLALLAGCGRARYEAPGDVGPNIDAALTDAPAMDAGRDASPPDAFVPDAPAHDAVGPDAFTPRPDAGPTEIVTVTGPTPRNYVTGETLRFTVTYDAVVTVTGTPTIGVVIDATEVSARYVSGSGGTVLLFDYVVLAGDIDPDGIEVRTPLLPSGGAVLDAASGPAGLSFTPPDLSRVTINVWGRCPTGFVPVPGNPLYGTADFCIAKYPMRQLAARIASVPTGPLAGIHTPELADAACAALGAGYGLMTNEEHQTVARNIESVAENWSGLGAATGVLHLGLDSVTTGAVDASADDTNDCAAPYLSCRDPSSRDFFHKRTHLLDNGAIVWDLGGVGGWVLGSHPEIARVNICSLTGADQVTAGPLGDFHSPCAPYDTLDPDYVLTRGLGYCEGSGGTRLQRGGAGIFYMNNNPFWSTDHPGAMVPYRCVFRPSPAFTVGLSLAPARVTVASGRTQAFSARGGTPPYTITLSDSPSGGSYVTTMSVYTAGATTAVTDTLTLRDATGAVTTAIVRIVPVP